MQLDDMNNHQVIAYSMQGKLRNTRVNSHGMYTYQSIIHFGMVHHLVNYHGMYTYYQPFSTLSRPMVHFTVRNNVQVIIGNGMSPLFWLQIFYKLFFSLNSETLTVKQELEWEDIPLFRK